MMRRKQAQDVNRLPKVELGIGADEVEFDEGPSDTSLSWVQVRSM
eukprot:CAMPEP_0204886118 /NCGR_PEP_ID=MMETSP1349-20130617/14514_1 /ASSEMBLY_ACC=CAM_ASM_000710 /TAXON_ID=215587 /ORGANISM="Aplanochytrium stocchinoi, Strain GSBS06" /LENGTH=44 /DNA_ID= /DNA_START= /DNA_END= /DNA_ORIENTATION=